MVTLKVFLLLDIQFLQREGIYLLLCYYIHFLMFKDGLWDSECAYDAFNNAVWPTHPTAAWEDDDDDDDVVMRNKKNCYKMTE